MPINVDPSQLEPVVPEIDPAQLEPVRPAPLPPLDKARAASEALGEPLIDPIDIMTHAGLGVASVLREPAEASAEELAERTAGGLGRRLGSEAVKSAALAARGRAGITTTRQPCGPKTPHPRP